MRISEKNTNSKKYEVATQKKRAGVISRLMGKRAVEAVDPEHEKRELGARVLMGAAWVWKKTVDDGPTEAGQVEDVGNGRKVVTYNMPAENMLYEVSIVGKSSDTESVGYYVKSLSLSRLMLDHRGKVDHIDSTFTINYDQNVPRDEFGMPDSSDDVLRDLRLADYVIDEISRDL